MPDQGNKALTTLDMVSFAALLLAAVLFLYMAFYRTAEQNGRHFATLTKTANEEIKTLTAAAQLKAIQASTPKEGGGPSREDVSDLPALLQKINSETISSGMELSQIEKLDKDRYKLTAQAPFDRLILFLFRIEQANLAVEDMEIHPLAGHKDQVSMVLRVLGYDMSQENRQVLSDFRKSMGLPLRNPFKKDAGSTEMAGSLDQIDLTWKFKLTGTGMDRGGGYANIDHKHYYKDDIFNGMRVTRIEKDRVELESDTQKFFMTFRRKKPGAK